MLISLSSGLHHNSENLGKGFYRMAGSSDKETLDDERQNVHEGNHSDGEGNNGQEGDQRRGGSVGFRRIELNSVGLDLKIISKQL